MSTEHHVLEAIDSQKSVGLVDVSSGLAILDGQPFFLVSSHFMGIKVCLF